MLKSLKQLISGKKFEEYRQGLEPRFRAHNISFSITYSERSSNPSLYISLEGKERLGDICVWESGDCDVNRAVFKGEGIQSKHLVLASPDDFQSELGALFRFITDKQFANDNWASEH